VQGLARVRLAALSGRDAETRTVETEHAALDRVEDALGGDARM
jgi:hypothetical protein